MKKTLIISFTLLLIFTPFLIGADEEEDSKVKAKVVVGTRATSNTNYIGKVGEYTPLNKGLRPVAAIALTGVSNSIFYSLKSYYSGDTKDQSHVATVDAGRVVTAKVSFDSMIHRLDHDPLTNLDVASEARSGVFHTDYDPTKQYQISRSEFTANTQLKVPALPFLKLYANYRDEHREGEYQARTLSKCSSCHVVAKSRSINNSTKDYNLGSQLSFGKVNLDYSYTKRTFRENEAAPTHTYLTKLHPEKVSPVFNSRIQYDSADGPLPFDILPDTDKQTHLIKANAPITNTMTLSGHYLSTSVKNNYNGLTSDSTAFAGGFSMRVGQKGIFNARFSQIRIKNETVFVDVNEPLDVAGPFAGKTYQQAYPSLGVLDWYRESALSRETIDFDTSFRYRFSKKAKFRLNYEFKKIDRDNYEVSTTSSHTFKGSFDVKPSKELKLNLSGRIKATDSPFTNLYAGLAPAVQLNGVPNPFVGAQFTVFHEARQAHMTNLPTDLSEIKGTVTWSPSYRFSISGNILYRAEKNDKLNFSTWENDTLNLGGYFWLAPAERLTFTGAYYFYGETLNSLFAIPVLEGCGGGIIGGFPGTLTDMMTYDIDTHTAFFKTNYTISEKVTLFGTLSYNGSLAKMTDLFIDINQLADPIPNVAVSPFDYEDVPESVEYSDLNIKQLVGDMGILYRLSEKWGLRAQATYYFVDDLAPYLFDGSGSSLSFFVSVIYSH